MPIAGQEIRIKTNEEIYKMGKKVYLGNDTAGYFLKTKCIEYLRGKGIPYVDCGSEDDPAKGLFRRGKN